MIDELHKEYYTLLNGNITYNGSTVNIYEEPPVSASYPYIQFSGFTTLDDSTKDTFGKEATFSVQIVDRFQGNFGSRKSVYSVLSDAEAILRTRPSNAFQLSNHNVLTTTIDNVLFRKERSENYTYFILEVRLRHITEEK